MTDSQAHQRRLLADRLFRLAPLNGVRGLSLEGLSVEDLRRLELLVQHVEQKERDLEHKARRARMGLP